MDDLFYLGISVVLLALTMGLLKMCDVLQPHTDQQAENKSGGKV